MASNSQDTYIDVDFLPTLSNYETTFMDPYLHAIESNYDKLFRQLHLFNLAQEQLVQAIRDDASEGDLRAHLDSTLLKITDGANEKQGDFAEFTNEERENGEARLGPASPDVLARGRVYEKALGEASHNTRIQKFLVMELEKDANVTDYLSLNLPIVHRLFQLHLFNLAQKQLLQAICVDASEADLRAHLDCTLLRITDGANDEQGDFTEFTSKERENGKARPGPESPDMLARGRVYEKALGEARRNTRIEKFLVMELQKDANLTDYLSLNLPEVRRLKIACWAATCNFVHMVMALIHWRDEDDRKFLDRVVTIAVEFGYVELVERLTELEEVNVDEGRDWCDFDDIYLREVGEPIKRIDRTSGCLYYYAFRERLTPFNLAAKLGNVEMVNTLLACSMKRSCELINIPQPRPLHWAAEKGHAEVVNAILRNKEPQFDVNAALLMTVDQSLIVNRLSYVDDISFNRWDGSIIGPLYGVEFTPLQLASLYGHTSVVKALCDDPKGRLGATIENHAGVTALQIATEMKRDEIVKILTDIPEVQKDVKRLYRERQVHVDAANAILVGAALIASVTFAGWLQPPSGYSPFFGSASLELGAPIPSGMYPLFVSVEAHPIMKIFWIFNCMSFFFAIATLMVGATAARPPKKNTYIGVVLPSLRTSLRLAYALLSFSIACVIGAFASAGFVVLPPVRTYCTIMQATVGIGMMVVFLAWTLSTVRKILFKVIIRSEVIVVEYIYKNKDSKLKPILCTLHNKLKLIKKKIQID